MIVKIMSASKLGNKGLRNVEITITGAWVDNVDLSMVKGKGEVIDYIRWVNYSSIVATLIYSGKFSWRDFCVSMENLVICIGEKKILENFYRVKTWGNFCISMEISCSGVIKSSQIDTVGVSRFSQTSGPWLLVVVVEWLSRNLIFNRRVTSRARHRNAGKVVYLT